MSAINSIRTYSDQALNGAIKSLSLSNEWWQRLHILLKEKQRREKLGITISAEQHQLPI